MVIYKTRWFDRWARKRELTTPALCDAVREMVNGLFDADLGGGLFKKRIARSGQGKSGGYRTLVATNKGQSLGLRVWLPEERAQQHRQGRRGSIEEVGGSLVVADRAGGHESQAGGRTD